MTMLPASVLGTLNHVLHQAFYPEGRAFVQHVFVVAKDIYHSKTTSDCEKSTISPGNCLIDDVLYVKNCSLSDGEVFGPFTMEEIYGMTRVPNIDACDCLTYLNDRFPNLSDLSDIVFWELSSAGNCPKTIDEVQPSIKNALKFVRETYETELAYCIGVIVLPYVIRREECTQECIKMLQRDGFYITMVKIDKIHWVILQSCRTAFFENVTAWFFVHKQLLYQSF